MNAGAKRRGDDAGKDNNARSAPKRRTQASAAAPPESPASCTEEQRGEFSAPKAFVLHAAQPPEPEALISQRLPARARTCLLFHTITLESAAERARRASAPTHAAQPPAAPWHSSARPLKPLWVHKFSERSRGAASESFCESNTLYKTPRPKHSRRNEVRAGSPNRSTARGNRSPKHAFRQSMLAISSLSHYFLITS